jgi:hypothetical protein
VKRFFFLLNAVFAMAILDLGYTGLLFPQETVTTQDELVDFGLDNFLNYFWVTEDCVSNAYMNLR